MKAILLSAVLLVGIIGENVHAQSIAPKREFRGAWIATVINLDWPSTRFLGENAQQSELLRILDELQDAGINAVFFQIRCEADAFYQSDIEPWSYWLTGSQGNAPEGFYDPLAFAVEEAHKRGMELHAWLNPYRAVREVGNYVQAPNHVTNQHPDWILTFNTIKILNPGLPAAREHITTVVMDVVSRYDVDGVHFDDYFYPYPPNEISTQDASTFQNFNRGFTNVADWRRDNVNLLVAAIYDSIQAVKPNVKFGISPFGIWRSGVPAGISGLDAYSTIYTDALEWLAQEKIDYIAPQLYWPFGGGQDYGKLQPWWGFEASPRHLYVGQAAYRISEWRTGEIQSQLAFNRSNPDVQGSIFFRALYFRENPRGFTDYLRSDHYRYLALQPQMAWKDDVVPNEPRNLRYERIAGTGTAALKWDSPEIAADGDSARRYLVYQFDQPTIQDSELEDPGNIMTLSYQSGFIPETIDLPVGKNYYGATAIDGNANESALSNIIEILPPATPILAMPANGAGQQPEALDLVWQYPPVASSCRLQVSPDSTFTADLLLDEAGLLDTTSVVFDMDGQQTYYWRVSASNPSGESSFSEPFSFKTGFPVAPLLAAPPENAEGIPLDVHLFWNRAVAATSYQLQISTRPIFTTATIVIDVEAIADTSYTINQLEPEKIYFWRIKANNSLGSSNWSEAWRFKTGTTTGISDNSRAPLQFELLQNYPNPFNPTTMIPFTLAKSSSVQLKIYDILGREVTVLVNRTLQRGRYEIEFNANILPSGVYYYRLVTDEYVATRKMLYLK